MRLIFFALLVFLTSGPTFARILVVTDIDDTLKISHVRSWTGIALNAPRTDVVFAGMPELLQVLASNPEVEFVYLSNAPDWLMDETHRAFLHYNRFPKGRIMLRTSEYDSLQFKPAALQKLADEDPSQRMILLGDNGERDPIVYNQALLQNPGREGLAFIHAIYPNNVEGFPFSSIVRPYGSAYDLALQFMHESLLSLAQVETIQQVVYWKLILDLKDEGSGEQVFPVWTDCHPHLTFDDIYITPEWRELLQVGCALGR